ncbi:hypothetical protein PHAVU_011G167100, partial [Phaseolus vulgaris]
TPACDPSGSINAWTSTLRLAGLCCICNMLACPLQLGESLGTLREAGVTEQRQPPTPISGGITGCCIH